MKKLLIKLTGLRLVGSLLGLLYSILQIRYFGATSEVDGFFIATSAVYLIISLTQSGQISEVILPEYLKQKNLNGIDLANKIVSLIITRVAVFSLILLSVLYFLSDLLIRILGPGLDEKTKVLSSNLFQISLILILLTIISSILSTILNAEKIFGRTEMSGIINSIVSILLLIFLSKHLGIYVLVISLLAGKIVELLLTIFLLLKTTFRYSFVWRLKDYNFARFISVLYATSGYVLSTQLYNVVLTSSSSYLPTGSLSIFKHVQQLSTKGSAIFIGPISGIFFTNISDTISKGKKNIEYLLVNPILWSSIIVFFIISYIITIGFEGLSILWNSKSISLANLEYAHLLLLINFIGLFFSANGQFFRKTSIAFGGAAWLYKRWIFVQLISALLGYFLIKYLHIYGLGITTPLNMILMFLVTMNSFNNYEFNLREVLNKLKETNFFKFILFSLLISVLTSVLINYFEFNFYIGLLIKFVLTSVMLLFLSYTLFGQDFDLIKDIKRRFRKNGSQ